MKKILRQALSLLLSALLILTGILITPPAVFAAFPSVAGSATSSRASSVVDDPVTLPASVAASDLIIVFHFSDGAATPITRTFPSPWVEINDTQNAAANASLGVGYLIASGGETSVTVTKSVAERFSAIAIRISASSWHGTTPPEISTGATGTSANPNPDAVTASWGSDDNLFIALHDFDNSLGGNTTTAYPTNYASNNLESPDVSSASRGAIASRELAAASDDPGTFTITSDEWWAGTIVVRPSGGAAPVPPPRRIIITGEPVRPVVSVASFRWDSPQRAPQPPAAGGAKKPPRHRKLVPGESSWLLTVMRWQGKRGRLCS